MLSRWLSSLSVPLSGEPCERQEPCRMCGAFRGILIAQTDFWDLRRSMMVYCENCGLIQLDPMLTEAETARGCLAYYIEETLRTRPEEQKRNLLRNFRRGVLFALSLKRKGIHPESVLEFGPGSGYFMEGIRYVFPAIRITVVDINPVVLAYNNRHHGYETILSTFEETDRRLQNRFDLIVARDIIEHVSDIGRMIAVVKRCAKPGALFHFITPNGHEDVWKHFVTWQLTRKPSQLLINHVNYFDGQGLLNFLETNGLTKIDYYSYNLKTTLRGQGRKVRSDLMAKVSTMEQSGYYIDEKQQDVKNFEVEKADVLNAWYIGKGRTFLTALVSRYQHAVLIKVDPQYNIGHEIYGLFRIKE